MFSNLYPPIASGSSHQCAKLAFELAKRGCKVIIITANINTQSFIREVADGMIIYRIPCFKFPRLPIALNFPWLLFTLTINNFHRINEILNDFPPDLIHLQNHIFDLAIFAVLMARRLERPLIITIHTMLRHSHKFYDFILRVIDKLFFRFLVIRSAKLLICPDQTISDYVSQTYGNVITTLIPYGIDETLEPLPGKMLGLRQKYNLGDGPIILSLGHLHEVRNRKELIELLPRLIYKFPNIKLLIVGDIGTRSTKKLAFKLGVRNHVIFTGPIPHNDLPEYFGIADIEAHWFYINHPNRSLGIAALEAMSAGKVVMSTSYENIYGDGVLLDGVNVILIDLLNPNMLETKMVNILSDEPKRREIGIRARLTIEEHFSWGNVCQQTIREYQNVLLGTMRT